ncbi:MAG TPA: methyltransferase domain-containing protein [Ktedonobacterales bacterium]
MVQREDLADLIVDLDHVQIAAPPGAEEAARAFYGGVLGLREIAKPEALRGRGGVWFAVGADGRELHVGIEEDFHPQRKAHPAFRVRDLAAVRRRIEDAGRAIVASVAIPGRERIETSDPFGNRLEFTQMVSDEAPEDADEAARARVRAAFGASAEAYVVSPGHAHGDDLARLVELAAPRPTDHALDVSTGGGHVALALAPHVARVTASDLTPAMLVAARRHLSAQGATNVDYVIADAEHLPFLDASFDLVTVRIAPHHYPDAARAVREMARVLAPGGRLVVIDNIAPPDPQLDALLNEWEQRRDPSHIRAYTADEWQALVAGARLHLTAIETGWKAHPFAPWAERMRMPADAQAALERDMLAAPPHAHDYFRLQARDGHLESWSAEYVILAAEKPAGE